MSGPREYDCSDMPGASEDQLPPRSSHCYSATKSPSGVWMDGNGDFSVSRMIAHDVMRELKLNDINDWRTRDRIVMAICDRVDGVLDFVADNEGMYKRAMESMAAQMVHPKMTAKQMAEMQLSRSE